MYIVQRACRQKQAMVPFTEKQPSQKHAAQETGVNLTSQPVTDAKHTPYTFCCQSFTSFLNHPQPSAYCLPQLVSDLGIICHLLIVLHCSSTMVLPLATIKGRKRIAATLDE